MCVCLVKKQLLVGLECRPLCLTDRSELLGEWKEKRDTHTELMLLMPKEEAASKQSPGLAETGSEGERQAGESTCTSFPAVDDDADAAHAGTAGAASCSRLSRCLVQANGGKGERKLFLACALHHTPSLSLDFVSNHLSSSPWPNRHLPACTF